jgi:hypothetical protein
MAEGHGGLVEKISKFVYNIVLFCTFHEDKEGLHNRQKPVRLNARKHSKKTKCLEKLDQEKVFQKK